MFNYAQQIVFDIDEEEEDADVNALDGFEWFDEDDDVDELDELDETDIESGNVCIVLRRTVGDDEDEREHLEVDENCLAVVGGDNDEDDEDDVVSVPFWKCL